jgi:hypothetical protein
MISESFFALERYMSIPKTSATSAAIVVQVPDEDLCKAGDAIKVYVPPPLYLIS